MLAKIPDLPLSLLSCPHVSLLSDSSQDLEEITTTKTKTSAAAARRKSTVEGDRNVIIDLTVSANRKRKRSVSTSDDVSDVMLLRPHNEYTLLRLITWKR